MGRWRKGGLRGHEDASWWWECEVWPVRGNPLLRDVCHYRKTATVQMVCWLVKHSISLFNQCRWLVTFVFSWNLVVGVEHNDFGLFTAYLIVICWLRLPHLEDIFGITSNLDSTCLLFFDVWTRRVSLYGSDVWCLIESDVGVFARHCEPHDEGNVGSTLQKLF